MPSRYRIQFPPEQEHDLSQDEAYFNLIEEGTARKILFHEYDRIFSKPGLYEQLFLRAAQMHFAEESIGIAAAQPHIRMDQPH